MRLIPLLLILPACVKGNPQGTDDTFVDTGGSLAVAGCGYSVTTRLGAEPPKLASDAFGTDPTPIEVHLGLMADAKTSVVAQWRTVDETTRASTIRYAVGANLPASALTQSATGLQFGFKATGTQIYRVHQAHLCNLTPGTTYSYQVGGKDPITGEHFSPVYTFHTAPDITAHPDAEVVFGFVGDSRGGYDVWQQLIDQLASHAPDLILFSGDAVTVGLTQYEWEDFFTRAEPLFATVPVVSAHGNHEVNAVNYYSQLALPGDQQNFGLDYGFAHVTVANDTPDDPSAITGAYHDLLESDLAAHASARWKIVMHHQPLWSASTRHGSSVTLQQAWQPVFDQNHVDLVLNGHDHDYEVSKPLVGSSVQTTSDNATVYVVAGGAGAELYPNGTDFWTQYSESTYSAAILHVRRDQLTLDAFRPDGSAIPTGFAKTKP
jgi:hypothetical protein